MNRIHATQRQQSNDAKNRKKEIKKKRLRRALICRSVYAYIANRCRGDNVNYSCSSTSVNDIPDTQRIPSPFSPSQWHIRSRTRTRVCGCRRQRSRRWRTLVTSQRSQLNSVPRRASHTVVGITHRRLSRLPVLSTSWTKASRPRYSPTIAWIICISVRGRRVPVLLMLMLARRRRRRMVIVVVRRWRRGAVSALSVVSSTGGAGWCSGILCLSIDRGWGR